MVTHKRPILNAEKGNPGDPKAFSLPPALQSASIIGLLLCAVFATFSPVCMNDFAGFDDAITLYRNPRLHPDPPETVLQSAGWYWHHAEYALYIPITYQVWALLTPLAHLDQPGPHGVNLDPRVFHAASLCVHALTVLAVYLLLRALVRHNIAAALGALIYGLHPLQVESVAWASGMKDLLSGLGVMLALWQYVLHAATGPNPACAPEPLVGVGSTPSPPYSGERAGVRGRASQDVDSTNDDRGKSRFAPLHYLLAIVFLTFAMLCKPSAMIAPLIAVVLDWLIVGRSLRRSMLSALPLLLAIVPWIIIAKHVQGGSPLEIVPLAMRPLIATDAIAFYLYKLAVPWNLAACYARRPAFVLANGWQWWTWIVPAAIAIAILLWKSQRRRLGAAALVLLLALLPVVGLVPFDYQRISTVADHYMYVAMLGPAIAIACAASRGLAGRISSRVWLIGGAVACLLLAGLSAIQTLTWRDQLTLWQHAVAVAPQSPYAHLNFAIAIGREHAANPEFLPVIYGEFREAADLNPRIVKLQDYLGATAMQLGRIDEAVEHMKLAIELEDELGPDPQESDRRARLQKRRTLAHGLCDMHRYHEAAEIYRSALRIDPNDRASREGLAEAMSH